MAGMIVTKIAANNFATSCIGPQLKPFAAWTDLGVIAQRRAMRRRAAVTSRSDVLQRRATVPSIV